MTKALPSTISDLHDLTFGKRFALNEKIALYEKDPSKNSLVIAPIKNGLCNAAATVRLSGLLFTDGILISEEFKTHSLGFEFESEDDAEKFNETVVKVFDDIPELESDDWTYRDFMKGDNKVWLKLKADKGNSSYSCKSNVKLHPKKSADSVLISGDPITVLLDLAAYFSLKDKVYGITPKVREIIVGEQPASV